MVDKACEQCGAAFLVRPYRALVARFCSRHCAAVGNHPVGPLNPLWRGGTTIDRGYVVRQSDGRPPRREHDLIVERVLGRPLPVGAVVHHVNSIKHDNVNKNLVVLQSRTEHLELHRKTTVRAAGGDPWLDRMCCSCGPRPKEKFRFTKSTRRLSGRAFATECVDCAVARQRAVRNRKQLAG